MRAAVQRELEEEAAAIRAASSRPNGPNGPNGPPFNGTARAEYTRAADDESNGSHSRPGTATSRRSESSFNSGRWSDHDDQSVRDPPDYTGEDMCMYWSNK